MHIVKGQVYKQRLPGRFASPNYASHLRRVQVRVGGGVRSHTWPVSAIQVDPALVSENAARERCAERVVLPGRGQRAGTRRRGCSPAAGKLGRKGSTWLGNQTCPPRSQAGGWSFRNHGTGSGDPRHPQGTPCLCQILGRGVYTHE